MFSLCAIRTFCSQLLAVISLKFHFIRSNSLLIYTGVQSVSIVLFGPTFTIVGLAYWFTYLLLL